MQQSIFILKVNVLNALLVLLPHPLTPQHASFVLQAPILLPQAMQAVLPVQLAHILQLLARLFASSAFEEPIQACRPPPPTVSHVCQVLGNQQ